MLAGTDLWSCSFTIPLSPSLCSCGTRSPLTAEIQPHDCSPRAFSGKWGLQWYRRGWFHISLGLSAPLTQVWARKLRDHVCFQDPCSWHFTASLSPLWFSCWGFAIPAVWEGRGLFRKQDWAAGQIMGKGGPKGTRNGYSWSPAVVFNPTPLRPKCWSVPSSPEACGAPEAGCVHSLPPSPCRAGFLLHTPPSWQNPNPREAKAEGNTWGGEAGLAGRAAPAPSCERQAQLWLPARAAAELCSAPQRRLPAPPSCFKDTYIITSLYRRIFLPSVVKGTGNNSVKITVQLDCSASFEKIKKGGV